MQNKVLSFDIPEIMSYQQNRYPMLLIDKITDCVPMRFAKGYKLFSCNEWYFGGYEIKNPKVWSSIQIEAMTQVFLMTFLTDSKYRGQITASNKFNNVKFFKKIEPGDKIEFKAVLDSFRNGIARGKVEGRIIDMLICSMECTIVLPDVFKKFQRMVPKKSTETDKKVYAYNGEVTFGINKIKKCMSNNFPWLYIDKVLEIVPGKFVQALKNFTYNEPYFPSHFPGNPNVPGFIQIESCLQSFFLTLGGIKNSDVHIQKLNNVLLKRKIVPGDVLDLFATLESFSNGIAKGKVESFVNNEPTTSFEIVVKITSRQNQNKSNN